MENASNATPIGYKVCPGCKQEKSVECFGKDRHSADGIRIYCKQCVARKQREYYRTRKQAQVGGGNNAVTGNPELANITSRQLLAELKARGYVWSDMKVITSVSYDKI